MSNKTLSGLYSFIALATLCLSACSTYVGPGQTGAITHLETPAYRGEDVSANYISGSLTAGSRYRLGDKNTLGGLSFHRSNAFSTGSISYGAFGYAGRYSFGENRDSLLSAQTQKPYGGFGLMFSSNVYLLGRKKVDWDVLKFSVRLYNELGEYPRFKRDLISKHDRYVDLYARHNSIIDMALSTGVRIRHEGMATTSINWGFAMHAFPKECSKPNSCYTIPLSLWSLNLQIAHSFKEVPITFSLLLSTSTLFDDYLLEDRPAMGLSLGYRFGDKKRKTETIYN